MSLTLELNSDQLNELRDALGRAASEHPLPLCLRLIDHRIGVALGCDRDVLYQDILWPERKTLVREDGSIDLNAVAVALAPYGETDLELAERMLVPMTASMRAPKETP